MSRNLKVYVQDMLEHLRLCESFTQGRLRR